MNLTNRFQWRFRSLGNSGGTQINLRAVTPNGASETATKNNQMSSYVTVLEGGINVLFLEGEFRSEFTYLMRALNSSPDIKVDYSVPDLKAKGGRVAPLNLADQVKPGKYRCYIIGDLDSDAFHKEDLEAIANNVMNDGAGFDFTRRLSQLLGRRLSQHTSRA